MPSYGYDGPITADQWAKLQQFDYAVYGVNDCKAAANSSGVQIPAGTIYGWGVMDVLTAATQVTLTAPGTGQSWWMVCARRTWGSTLLTTFVAIPAGTSRPSSLPARQATPGVVDDQPIALVGWTAGQSQPSTVVDLRVVGTAGQQVVFDQQALQYLTRPGRQVRLDSSPWVCVVGSGGALEWRQISTAAHTWGRQFGLSVTSGAVQSASFVAAVQVLPAVTYQTELFASASLAGIITSGGEWRAQIGYDTANPGSNTTPAAVLISDYMHSASPQRSSAALATATVIPANTQVWLRTIAIRTSGNFTPEDSPGATLTWTRREI